MADATLDTVDLLQQLIRNACVNDGTPQSGQEWRNAALLGETVSSAPLDIETYEPLPGRRSLVARLEGRDATAPSLLLMGHTDVVPVQPDGWRHDPFGGELIDGEVWGRGAIDMLNLTASMAIAVRDLARSGFSPRGTLIYLAVADEEALGTLGAGHLIEREPDAIRADYAITESGGIPIPTPAGPALPVLVAEKGVQWWRVRVRGTPGHGSQPYRVENALVRAAQIVQRLADHDVPLDVTDVWRRFVDGMAFDAEIRDAMLSPERVPDLLPTLPLAAARQVHACTHCTIAPTVINGGSKVNTIPDLVELQLDVRTLPGQDRRYVEALLLDALGDLAAHAKLSLDADEPASASPVDTPLWDVLNRAAQKLRPGSRTVPALLSAATDARFLRRLGTVAYGFGLFSGRASLEEFAAMFHGHNERVDVESLGLSVALWQQICRELLA